MSGPAALPAPLRTALEGLPAGAVVALDGRCAAGKTTLAAAIRAAFPGTAVVHMDDFYLPAASRTPARMAAPGGNIHWERFLREVLAPMRRGEGFVYAPFSCKSQALLPGTAMAPGPLNVVEGSYSCLPPLREHYALRVFLDVDRAEQLRRIEARGGPAALADFQRLWIPREEAYFSACAVEACCQLTLRLG